MKQPLNQRTLIFISGAFFIVFVAILLASLKRPINNPPQEIPENVACTREAKQCPDGSYVERIGPDCSFAPCPSGEEINNSDSEAVEPIGSAIDTSPDADRLAAIPDLPDAAQRDPAEPLSVEYVVEHRSALHNAQILLSGIVVSTDLNAEEPSGDGPNTRIAHVPSITIAESSSQSRNTAYDIRILLPEDGVPFDVGQKVLLKGTVLTTSTGVELLVQINDL